MKLCPKCGAEMQGRFCSNCGFDTNTSVSCPKCGAEMQGRFCSNCGFDTNTSVSCPKCGVEMQGRFCSNCGFDTQASAQASVSNKKDWVGKIKDFFRKAWGFLKSHKKITAIASLSVVVIIALSITISALSNIFRVGKVEKIELGMSTSQVEDILGKPTDKSENDNVWYYYEKKFAKKYEQLNGSFDDMLDMDEEISEEDFEDALEDMDSDYSELEEMTFKAIIVSFSKDGVSRVVFDKNHKYDEDDDYATEEEKTVKKTEIEMETDNIDVFIHEKVVELDDGQEEIQKEVQLSSQMTKVRYSVKFKDGSYLLGMANPKLELNDENVMLKWSDAFCEYTEKCAVGNYKRIRTDADGVLIEYEGKLNNIILPDGVNRVSSSCFDSSMSTYSITLSKTVESLDGCNEFASVHVVEENPYFKSVDGVVYSKDGKELLLYPDGKTATEFTIPDGVETVGKLPYKITNLFIPASLTTTLNTFGKPTRFFDWASDILSLQAITVAEGNEKYKSIDGVVYSKDGKELLFYPKARTATEFTIPDGVEMVEMQDEHFSNVIHLTVPASVTNLSISSYYVSSLQTITVAEENQTYKSIDGVLYSKNGKKLLSYPKARTATEFTIPDGVEMVGGNFGSVTHLTVSASVISLDIGGSALQTITVVEENQTYKSIDGVVYSKDGKELLLYPDGKTVTEFTIPDGVEGICDFISESIQHLSIPATLNWFSEGYYGFHDFAEWARAIPSLQAINIAEENETYKSIDGVVYSKDGKELLIYPREKANREFTIPDGVETVKLDNDYLYSLTIPASVQEFFIYGNRLVEFVNLSVALPEKSNIQSYAFGGYEQDVYYSTTFTSNIQTDEKGFTFWMKDGKKILLEIAQNTTELLIEKDMIVEYTDFTGVNIKKVTIASAGWREDLPSTVQELVLLEGATYIPELNDCANLKKIVIPETVEYNYNKILQCPNLENLELEASGYYEIDGEYSNVKYLTGEEVLQYLKEGQRLDRISEKDFETRKEEDLILVLVFLTSPIVIISIIVLLVIRKRRKKKRLKMAYAGRAEINDVDKE